MVINKDRKKGSYIKAGPGNPFFDFVLWEAETNKVRIAFVDATISLGKIT